MGTDVDCVFSYDSKLNKKAKLVKILNGKNINNLMIEKSFAIDVTGGMNRKAGELIKLAKIGIKSEIINIAKQNILKKALRGEKELGTIINK
jgi:isopentenyl phosphate kinase